MSAILSVRSQDPPDAASSRQGELIALARHLACERFAPRADRHDGAASFPFDNYADLRAERLLGLCVPERYGGLGADYETYCLVCRGATGAPSSELIGWQTGLVGNSLGACLRRAFTLTGQPTLNPLGIFETKGAVKATRNVMAKRLMMGPIADSMPMSPTARERHEQLRAAKFREIVGDTGSLSLF